MGVWVVLLAAACTVGEPQPSRPSVPETEPAAERPESDPESAPEPAASADVEARAAELLAEAEQAYGAGEVEEASQVADEVIRLGPSTARSAARWIAARSAFALGRYGEAGELAEAVAADPPSTTTESEARAVAELAADALEAPADAPVVIGALLPRTGPRVLVRYGDWVLEGIEVAVAEAERRQNRRIELVVADDEGGLRVGEAVGELERQGALAIVGPLLPEHMSTAAGARRDARTLLVSPTSTESPRWPETYSINSGDPRGAQELGRYAADIGLRQAALLYPRMPEFERKARAFASEYEALGGVVRAMIPYDSGTTTFSDHMERVLAAVGPAGGAADAGVLGARADTLSGAPVGEPFALFVPAPPRDVPQIAPQVGFYGLDSAGVQLFGDEAWASAPVRRLVPARDLEGVIAASSFPPDRASGAADPAFVQRYEETYRRSLENQIPALGYDAAHLMLQALPNRRLEADAVARRFDLLAGIRGATGLLSVRGSSIVRTPYLVRIEEGGLVPAPYPWEYERPVPRSQTGSGTARGGRRR
jgi:ABC-type branched-subunit amino acid transport system substrate-binding protein